MCVEKSNTKKEKEDNASCSKEDYQSCGKSVCCKHALRICEYFNNNANQFHRNIRLRDLAITILQWFILL